MSSSLSADPTQMNGRMMQSSRLSYNFRSSIQRLGRGQESEVLCFLEGRPLHTVFLRGFILDNGLESSLNRGTFYAYRDARGQLGGVALIGHATVFEARSQDAVRSFGRKARKHSDIHMIMGERPSVESFWSALGEDKEAPSRTCTELLLEQRLPSPKIETVPTLRRARIDDLGRVMPIQAQMAFAESGVNPMKADPAGFERRCARRIELNRVWVSVEDDTLMFKADILSETPEVTYLEGIYVDPGHRGNGYGMSCLAQLSQHLSVSTKSLCLFVNEEAKEAHEFYKRAGFALSSIYSTIFLDG